MIKFWAGVTACLVGLCAGYGLASRNASGTMAGINGPYTAGSVISSSVVNARFADIETEITDSASRSGKGGFTAPVRGADGTSTAPTYAFTSETTAGLYRAGSGDLRMTFNSTESCRWTSLGIRCANGAVATPSLSFFNDTGSGLYRAGSNDLRFAVNGADKTFWNATGFGIGVTAAFPLDISYSNAGGGTAETGLQIKNTATANSTQIRLVSNRDWSVYAAGSGGSPAGGFVIRDNTNSAMPFSITNADTIQLGNSGQVTIDSSGNLISTATLKMASAGTAITQINFGACTLNSGTPATCTATVNANSKCTANVVTTTAANTRDLGVTVSGTTLTITSQTNGDGWQVNYICMG